MKNYKTTHSQNTTNDPEPESNSATPRKDRAEFEGSELYRKLFENAMDMILAADDHARYIDANPAACEALGYTREELCRLSLPDVIPDAYRKNALESWKDFIEKGEAAGELTLEKKSGEKIVAEYRATANFVPGLHLSVLRDVTQRKIVEERFRLSYKNDALGALTGGIAHDFNNILAIILGNVELCMYEMPENFPLTRNLKEIREASTRARDLVRRLLAFSRKTEVRLEKTDLASSVEQTAKLLKTSIPRKIELRLDFSDDAAPVMADAGEINQLIIHLVNNAVDAMEKDGGELHIGMENMFLAERTVYRDRVLKPGHYVKLTVEDTGRGIPASHLPKIFDPYFTTKELGKGSGMGLSAVHGIVRVHMGAVHVDSRIGKGSVFSVILPASKREQEKKPSAPQGGPEKILFIDDEKPLVKMGRKILEKLGYRVEGRENPSEALELFEKEPDAFDLVITDMAMPDMDGDELSEKLLKIRPDLPIMLCTGFSEKISEKKAKKIGIGKYVKKPYSASKLAKSVRELLDVPS